MFFIFIYFEIAFYCSFIVIKDYNIVICMLHFIVLGYVNCINIT